MKVAKGDYVQTRRRIPPLHRHGTRGTVRSLEGVWVEVETPQGVHFEAHIDNITRLVRKEETLV